MKKILFSLALLAGTPALAEKKAPTPPPAEPATHPDWIEMRLMLEEAIKNGMFDPDSAKITWTRGPFWTSFKHSEVGIFAKPRWGWVVCGEFNGKNLYGGYTGREVVQYAISPDGKVRSSIDSDCDYGNHFGPVLEEFKPVTQVASGSVGLADELAKLAELRDKGILSAAEFEAQKAKLLAR